MKIQGKHVETKTKKKRKLGDHEYDVLNSNFENHLSSSIQSQKRKVNRSESETKSGKWRYCLTLRMFWFF